MRPRPLRPCLVAILCALTTAAGFAQDAQEGPISRERVPCRVEDARDLVLIPFGQSNAGNHIGSPYAPSGNVVNFNFLDGACYRARDPLLGAPASPPPHNGSIWSILGELLFETARWDRIVLAPIAVGGTFVRDWAPGGIQFPGIGAVVSGLKEVGLQPSAFLWVQGEWDANLSPDPVRYRMSFLAMTQAIRALSAAPIYVAIATTCGPSDPLDRLAPADRVRFLANQAAIERAQAGLVDPAVGIRAGPNLDLIGTDHRINSCHLDAFGQRAAAELWSHYLLLNSESEPPGGTIKIRRPSRPKGSPKTPSSGSKKGQFEQIDSTQVGCARC